MRREMDLDGGRDRAFACGNCLHVEDDSARGKPVAVPSPWCRNPLGLFSMDDCPVLLGGECLQFVERGGPPTALAFEESEEVRIGLLKDYLRWTYWERVRNLRRKPGEIPAKTVLEVEEKPEREDEEIVYHAPPPPVTAVEGEAAPAEKPKEEKYPGQRRSEDRFRRKKAAIAAARAKAAADADPAAAPAEGEEAPDAPAEPVVKSVEDVLAETPGAAPPPPSRRRGPGLSLIHI